MPFICWQLPNTHTHTIMHSIYIYVKHIFRTSSWTRLISNSLPNVSIWIFNKYLKLNMSKTELLIFPWIIVLSSVSYFRWLQLDLSSCPGEKPQAHPWLLLLWTLYSIHQKVLLDLPSKYIQDPLVIKALLFFIWVTERASFLGSCFYPWSFLFF